MKHSSKEFFDNTEYVWEDDINPYQQEHNDLFKSIRNGVHQIAHGSLFGWNPTLNYLLVEVKEDQLKCTLKEIDNIPIREGRKSLGITITEKSFLQSRLERACLPSGRLDRLVETA
jgi:hypothetical protein